MRVVSLLPSATEILFGIGAGPQIAGVTHECDFPAEARKLPVLTSSALPQSGTSAEIDRHVRRYLHQGSSLYHLDAERLAEIAPDLIVTQELCEVCAVSYHIVAAAARRLTGDPRVISLEPSSLEDVYANILTLGDLTDCAPGAQSLVESLRSRESQVRVHSARDEKPAILLLEWTDPPMSAGHWTPGLLESAGAAPVLANPGVNSRVLTWQEIAAADPDGVIVAPCGFDLDATNRAIAQLDENQTWRDLRAVRLENVFPVDGNAFVNRPGPRLIDTLEIFSTIVDRINCATPAND